MPNHPQRVVTLSREEALHAKVDGKRLALMELDDLQLRLDAIVDKLGSLASAVAELRRRYGPRTCVERLDDHELEQLLDVLHVLRGGAQTYKVE